MQLNTNNLVISDKIRKQMAFFQIGPAEVAKMVQESMSGVLPTLGRGIKRTERRDGKNICMLNISHTMTRASELKFGMRKTDNEKYRQVQ
jgi:hypothetical protein